MGDLEFTVSTDTEHVETLESQLIYAEWKHGVAYAGQKARFSIGTSFVGQGAKIVIKGKTASGDKLGEIKSVIRNNRFSGEFVIPENTERGEEIYFTVELPKNGLNSESNRIPVFPPVTVTDLKWSAPTARRGDRLTLSAEVDGLRPDAEILLTIYEHDADGAHDSIARIPASVKNGKVEVNWVYEYREPTRDIPTESELQDISEKQHYAHPEYFFTVTNADTEHGKDLASGLLRFQDVFAFEVTDEVGHPVPDQEYVLHLADKSERTGRLDGNGQATEENLPPGEVLVTFKDEEAPVCDEPDLDSETDEGDEDDEWVDEFLLESEL